MRMQSDPPNTLPSCFHIHLSQPPTCSERQLSSLQHAIIHCLSSPVICVLTRLGQYEQVRQNTSGTLRILDKLCNTITRRITSQHIRHQTHCGGSVGGGGRGGGWETQWGCGICSDRFVALQSCVCINSSNKQTVQIPMIRLDSGLVVSASCESHRSNFFRRSDVSLLSSLCYSESDKPRPGTTSRYHPITKRQNWNWN